MATQKTDVTPEMIQAAIEKAEQEKKDAAKKVRALKRLQRDQGEAEKLVQELVS